MTAAELIRDAADGEIVAPGKVRRCAVQGCKTLTLDGLCRSHRSELTLAIIRLEKRPPSGPEIEGAPA